MEIHRKEGMYLEVHRYVLRNKEDREQVLLFYNPAKDLKTG
jgi:hypothetical protein